MSDKLQTLHEYAVDLRCLRMLQTAGDFDYLVAWLKSPELNNGVHLKPHPAGKDTVDEYSNNCPIPFTACKCIIQHCKNKSEALATVQLAKSIIEELLDTYTSDLEQTAIHAYIEYADDLIALLSGEEPGPIPPQYTVAYVNATVGVTGKPLKDEEGNVLQYSASNNYIGIKWYDSEDTAHDISNIEGDGVWIDRRHKDSSGVFTLYIYSKPDSVAIDHIEYTTSPSGKTQAFLQGNDEYVSSVTLQPGTHHIVVDEDNNPITYTNFTAYYGRYRKGTGSFENFDDSFYLGKAYDENSGFYVLAVFNSSSEAVKIHDLEYATAAAHALNIISPDIVSGESCTISAIYDDTIVVPEWSITPSGPTISGGTLTFTESGTYILQASYNNLVATKQVNVEYKEGWSTDTVIDDTGDYPVSNTTTTDPDGNKESEIVAYIDGEPVNTGFELEPGSEDGTIVIDEGKDTKIYTFDGTNGFELFFKFHYDPSLQPAPDYADKPGETDTTKHFTMLNMKYEVPPYPGIAVRNNQNSNKIQVSITPINPTDPTKPTVYVDFDFTEDGIYDMYMRYEPSAPFEKFVIIDNLTGNVKTRFEHYTYEFSNDVTTTLGYVNAGTVEDPVPCRQCIFDVYDFRLNKIMNPWKDVPIITETTTHNGLLITKDITNDDKHIVKRLLVEPDPDVTSDEYVLLDDGLVFDDILPFIDSDQVFELEFDVKVSYEDQIPYNGQYQVLVNMIPEIQNHWPGFCVRLASEARPSSDRPNGAVDFRLRYTNDRSVYNNSLRASALFDIDEDHVMHYRYIYEGTAVRKCSALYSYKTDAYRIFTGSALYAVYPHDWPLCIGCALDENRQKSRVCKMYVKKIEYIRNIK